MNRGNWREEFRREYDTAWPGFFNQIPECKGYSGCNCWECGCECGVCFKCDPRAFFPMSAEQTLTTHWKACVESQDAVCISAFADHLIELWDTACAEDGEFARQTGGTTPVLRLVSGPWTLVLDHGEPVDVSGEYPAFEISAVLTKTSPFRAGPPYNLRRVWRNINTPSGWDYNTIQAFVVWVTEAITSGTRQPT